MEDNKNSLLGIEGTSPEQNVNAVPFSIALPTEEQSPPPPSNLVSIEPSKSSTVEATPQKTPVTAVPTPPVLLQKPEESKTNEVPFLLQKPEEEVPFLLQKPEEEVSAVNTLPTPAPSKKEESASSSYFTLETKNPSEKISGQKIKATASIGETTQKLSANEQKLKDIEQQVELKKEEIQKKSMASESYLALKPAFENIQNVLNFQKENAMTKDFDDSHYTVPQTQSFFDKTVNQLTDIPYWRGK